MTVPLIDDVTLDAVSWIRHRMASRAVAQPVLGLNGDVQQRLGRASHEVELAGVLIGVVGDELAERLAALQEKASTGEEVAFHADIATALEVEHMVIAAAEFAETAGRPGRYEYHVLLRESPPLPPPAEIDPFGGLDTDGLGFDALDSVLDDVADLADQVQAGLDAVNDALGQLEALAALGDLDIDSPVGPLVSEAEKLEGVADAAGAAAALGNVLGG